MLKIYSILGLFFSMIGISHAVVDAAVTTALTEANVDSVSIAVSVLVILVGIASIRYARRAL